MRKDLAENIRIILRYRKTLQLIQEDAVSVAEWKIQADRDPKTQEIEGWFLTDQEKQVKIYIPARSLNIFVYLFSNDSIWVQYDNTAKPSIPNTAPIGREYTNFLNKIAPAAIQALAKVLNKKK